MVHKCGIADSQLAYLSESGLQSVQKLHFELAVYFRTGICIRDISTDIGIEQKRIYDFIGIFAVAADAYIHIESDICINNSERNGILSAVLISHYLFGIEVVHSLILGRFTAEGETLAESGKALFDAFAVEAAVHDSRLGGRIINELARLVAKFHDLALFDYHHALSVCDCNYRTV